MNCLFAESPTPTPLRHSPCCSHITTPHRSQSAATLLSALICIALVYVYIFYFIHFHSCCAFSPVVFFFFSYSPYPPSPIHHFSYSFIFIFLCFSLMNKCINWPRGGGGVAEGPVGGKVWGLWGGNGHGK